ncbi:hypothetical protein [uncultured Litoreibacter sp.]|uniref:hypothetical protein n=1 Tax=uncultured Litoreibacter sp. TaxID=1392394 RepID=UPI002605BBE9|nr:hypothetical protein [uncultured Litoreibacter sp.]
MRFSKFLAATGMAVSLAAPVAAEGNLTQLQKSVSTVLPTYGYADVDVTKLNSSQLAQINHLAGSNKGHADIRGSIGAVIENRIVKFFQS